MLFCRMPDVVFSFSPGDFCNLMVDQFWSHFNCVFVFVSTTSLSIRFSMVISSTEALTKKRILSEYVFSYFSPQSSLSGTWRSPFQLFAFFCNEGGEPQGGDLVVGSINIKWSQKKNYKRLSLVLQRIWKGILWQRLFRLEDWVARI